MHALTSPQSALQHLTAFSTGIIADRRSPTSPIHMEAAMSGFVDFAAVKDHAPIEQVVSMLGLQLKPHGDQLRGACPVCGGGDPALVVTKNKKPFFFFPRKKAGAPINLVPH